MTVGEESSLPVVENKNIAGFWRRLLAICIDFLLLGLIGLVLGVFFADYFSSLGGWGRIIGFVIAWPYFGVMNSRICSGQTFGKELLKVKVTMLNGTSLSISKSLLRALVFCLPIFLNGAAFSMEALHGWFVYVLAILVFGFSISTVYLYVFNRRTRQSLHDLVVGSIVVKAAEPARKVSVVTWRGHYVATAIILVAATTVPNFVWKLANKEPFTSLLSLQKILASEPGVISVNISVGSSMYKNMNSAVKNVNYLSTNVVISEKNSNFGAMANHFAATMLEKYPESSAMDSVNITITHGYDIGIASEWNSSNFSFSPSKWRERIAPKSGTGLHSEATTPENVH